MELDRVSLPDSNEAPRYLAAECPECINNTFGDFHIEFANFHIDYDFCRVITIYRGRNIRRRSENSLHRITLRRPEIAGRGSSCIRLMCRTGCIVGLVGMA